jgi:4a-hydroxytetrahydrobiopterin dehydratase
MALVRHYEDVMKTELADKKCAQDGPQAKRLKPAEIKTLKRQLASGWALVKGKQLERQFKFPDFKEALAGCNRVGNLAEKQGHHPDVLLTYGMLKIQLSTHSAHGLTENDFIMAAKIDRLKLGA